MESQKQQPSPEVRCIAGSKVLLVRNYLTREHPPPKPERCLIQRVVSTETITETPLLADKPETPPEPPTDKPELLTDKPEPLTDRSEPPTDKPPRRLNTNAKLGITLTAAVAAVGLWWYAQQE